MWNSCGFSETSLIGKVWRIEHPCRHLLRCTLLCMPCRTARLPHCSLRGLTCPPGATSHLLSVPAPAPTPALATALATVPATAALHHIPRGKQPYVTASKADRKATGWAPNIISFSNARGTM
eukprot:253869-Chlamydomonas_euryale.AAC.4